MLLRQPARSPNPSRLVHFGIICDHFGINVGWRLGHFGIIWESFGINQFGIILGSFGIIGGLFN